MYCLSSNFKILFTKESSSILFFYIIHYDEIVQKKRHLNNSISP